MEIVANETGERVFVKEGDLVCVTMMNRLFSDVENAELDNKFLEKGSVAICIRVWNNPKCTFPVGQRSDERFAWCHAIQVLTHLGLGWINFDDTVDVLGDPWINDDNNVQEIPF